MIPIFLLFVVTSVISSRVEQVHLSLNGNLEEMVVTWITQDIDPNTPYVAFGLSSADLGWTSKATITEWENGGKGGSRRYTYRAVMRNLQAGSKYYYKVGSALKESRVFFFNQPNPNSPLRFGVFGDLSIKDGYSINPLIEASQNGDLDVIFHIGDLAYDLHDNDGKTGDDFMNAIEGITAYVPYMVLPGNHETFHNFNHIVNRFTMPNNGVFNNSLFWSFDYGITHFIGLNTEYYAELMLEEAREQYKWLEHDLKKNKGNWTVVMFHRPMYCSSKSEKGCHDKEDTITRTGDENYPGWEKLLFDHKVDLIFYGHKHTYERMWPMYQGIPFITKDSGHIKNPQAPIYILTGAAGCHSHEGPSDTIAQPFSITRLGNYGYTRVKVHNTTHLATRFVDTSSNGCASLDKFVIERE